MPTILQFPDDLVRNTVRVTFRLVATNLVSQAGLSRFIRASGPIDHRWMASISRGAEDIDDWARVEAFFNRLGGVSGLLTFWDPAYPQPRGAAWPDHPAKAFRGGQAFADGSGFSDVTTQGTIGAPVPYGFDRILLRGIKPNTQAALKENDRFSILHGPDFIPLLYTVLQDADTNGAGEASVYIAPRLREGIKEGDPVVFTKPRSVFQVKSDEAGMVERSYPLLGRSSFSLVEVPEVLNL